MENTRTKKQEVGFSQGLRCAKTQNLFAMVIVKIVRGMSEI